MNRETKRRLFPFSALVGQEVMKRALLLNAVDSTIGGVLIRGQKGTAKSTAVRALAHVLPELEVVEGCPFACAPQGPLCPDCRRKRDQDQALEATLRPAKVVTLPLGASEDRVCGTLDLEAAIRLGRKRLEPGLLAEAHRGVLYVDEVNLLPDHLVDIILDASAMGVNLVEREGISLAHAARFILIGTMNPEEGELRPQLLDRFGLCVEVKAPREVEKRREVLKRREYFDQAPELFMTNYAPQQEALRERIARARALLPHVHLPNELVELGSQLCQEAFVAGHRADIILGKAARALAALEGRDQVSETEVRQAAELVLAHRRRMAPPPPRQQEPPHQHEHDHQHEQEHEHPPEQPEPQQADPSQEASAAPQEQPQEQPPSEPPEERQNSKTTPPQEKIFPLGDPYKVKPFVFTRDRRPRKGSGRRVRSRTLHKTGRYVRSHVDTQPDDLALDATLRAAAPYQLRRERSGVAVAVRQGDLRQKVREKRIGNLIVFVVDASGSMGAGKRMLEAKGAVLSLLLDAYQKRDRVALVAFRREQAQVLLPPTNSIELAYRCLEELPTGGKTPLGHGLMLGYQVLDSQLRRDPHTYPVLVIISDGRANVSQSGGKPVAEALQLAERIHQDPRLHSVVIDVEKQGLITFGLAGDLAAHLGAAYYQVDDLRADEVVQVLRAEVLP